MGVSVLHDVAVSHDDELVGEGERLLLVMGHVDHGGAELALESEQLDARLDAELGVEVAERLVEEEDGWFADDGARDGDALLLATGELSGVAVEELRHAE